MKACDVIVVPGLALGENGCAKAELVGRLALAAQCYERGMGKTVAVCGGITGSAPVSEASVMADLLQRMGVPGEDILVEDRSRITYENMKNLLEMLGPERKKLLVVTSDYHMARTRLILRLLGRRSRGIKMKTPGGPRKRQLRRLEFYAAVDYLFGWGADDDRRPAWALRLKRFLQRRNGAL